MAAPKSPPTTIGAVKDIVPKLAELTEKVVFGDVWARPGLSKRDRSFATVAKQVYEERGA
jgi:4-carboxymuconolactone decarboxylase